MSERIHKCPNCGAVLRPGRFAREALCEFCKSRVEIDEAAVATEAFRAAYRGWNAPRAGDARSWFALGGRHWTELGLLARGEIADVFLVEGSRRPVERALLKVLRDPADLPLLEAEWRALHELRASEARGAEAIVPRLPDPIARGAIEGGPRAGAQAVLHRWVPGFEHTLEDVRAAFPRGVDARVATWIWRRQLELCGFLHGAGWVHGAILPQHLLVEQGEHGLRLVGFGCAAQRGGALAAVVARYEHFYPRALLETQVLQPAHDLALGACCVEQLLGADAPAPLCALLRSVAAGEWAGDAWKLHAQVWTLARELFGAPSFHPLVLPAPRAQPQPR